jgi:NAD(P)-dependent dehydrogenase (short-subunit alcohol dehydrogenase family)
MPNVALIPPQPLPKLSAPAALGAPPSESSRPYPLLSRLLAPRGCGRPDVLRAAVGGKVVLVTGASFGIGAALAKRLGAAGARVLLAARSGPRLAELAQEITDAGGRAETFPLDLSDPRQIEQVVRQLAGIPGGVDVVVHNAGKSIRRSLALSLARPHDFQRCMSVNYLGPVQLQLALLPAMLARGTGQIVNVSSVGVRLPAAPRWSAYLASKTAFDVWLGAAAPELGQAGVTCTSIYLGLVHTRMSAPTPAYRGMPGQTPDEAAQVICRALIRRPRSIGPWWLTPARWLAPPLGRPVEWLQGKLFARGADSPAARGARS